MLTTLRAAVLAVLTTLGLIAVVTPSSPAWACSCIRPSEQKTLADLIVTGTVTAVTERSVELVVDGVQKGSTDVGAPLVLRSGRYESSCGFGFRTGVRYRVNSVDGATGLCVGVVAMPPLPEAVTSASAPSSAPAVVAAPPPAPNRWWLPTAAALTLLTAGLVAVIVRRRRAR